MKITDEMDAAFAKAWFNSDCTAAEIPDCNDGDCACRKAGLAAVAPLIAQEAEKKIASLLRALSYEREVNALNVAHIEAQAKEIAELKAALAEYQSGRNYLGRGLVAKNTAS